MKKEIMVVHRDALFLNDMFHGFKRYDEKDYESRILKNFTYMRRGDVEENPEYKQPIAYCAIINPSLKKVFAFQRSKKDKNYVEKRLQGKWSWGVGGHIDKEDNFDGSPIKNSMEREIEEEIEFVDGKIINSYPLGYIYLGKGIDMVNDVHFGILYAIETDATIINPRDTEMSEGKLRNISELNDICSSSKLSVEDWSKTALIPLKEYFKEKK